MQQTRRGLRASSIAAAALMAALPKTATAEPPDSASKAVSQPNFKLESGGGLIDGDAMGGGALSLTLPLSQRFGLQADAAYFRVGGEDAWGGALHAFFRDSRRLLGVTALRADMAGEDLLRVGAETEFYLGRYTVAPSAGYQHFLDKDSAYGSLRLTYYPIDSLSLSLSAAGYSGAFGAGGSIEYQLAPHNLSLFIDAGGTDPGGGYVYAGVRLWFGGDGAGLIGRDRRDDPPNMAAFWNTPAGNMLLADALAPTGPPHGCFVAGAEVLMADGSTRRIEEVAIGDMVVGRDGASNAVAALQRPRGREHILMSINRGPFVVNTRHAIGTRTGWKAGHKAAAAMEYGRRVDIAQLTVGDDIRTHAGWERVDSIDMRSSGAIDVYNLITAGDNTFHVRHGANFMLVHG